MKWKAKKQKQERQNQPTIGEENNFLKKNEKEWKAEKKTNEA